MISDYQGSQFTDDIIGMDVVFEQIRAWVSYGKDLTKKDIIFMMRRIRGYAENIERRTANAGTEYFRRAKE